MYSPKQTRCIKKLLQLQSKKISLNSGLLSLSVVVISESVRSSLTFWLLSRTAFICKSSVFNSMKGLINDYEKEEDSEYKLERWLHDKLTSVRIFSSAVVTTPLGNNYHYDISTTIFSLFCASSVYQMSGQWLFPKIRKSIKISQYYGKTILG